VPEYRIKVVRTPGPEPVTGEHIEHAEEVIRVEGDTPWKAVQVALMKMEMNARGRLLRYYDADTDAEITAPHRQQVFRKGTFTMDAMEGPYPGYTAGESWNGWATPYFEFETANRIAEAHVRIPELMKLDDIEPGAYRAEYDEAEDAFLFYEPVNDEEAYYHSQTITVRGREVKVYPIGTREWTWEEDT